jgi:hypothetical protein
MLTMFVALAVALWNPEPPREDGKELQAKLIERVQQFQLRLIPDGPTDKPYYTVVLSVAATQNGESTDFKRTNRISADQARRIIDHLAELNWLDAPRMLAERPRNSNGYTLQIEAGPIFVERKIGWDLEMLESLDSLQSLVDGEAAVGMELLRGRMSGWRRVWQAAREAASRLEATVDRGDSIVRVAAEGQRIVIDVKSENGIGQVTVRRKGEVWPKEVVLRMRLKGMESLRVSLGETALEWSVASGGEFVVSRSVTQQGRERQMQTGDPLWGEARIVGEDKKVPLESGYFEVTVPASLLESQANDLKIAWIDFYR